MAACFHIMISNCLQNPRAVLNKVLYRKARHRGPTPYPLFISRQAALDYEGVRTRRKTRAPTEALQTGGLGACSPWKFQGINLGSRNYHLLNFFTRSQL